MKIKAAVLREYHKPLSIEELELDEPKANEVLVKVAATGFCRSDLHGILEEVPFPIPKVLGHETSGIVEKVGPGVTRVKPGDPVICVWNIPCGTCYQCVQGRGNICETYFDHFLNGKLLDGTSRLKDKKGKEIGHGFFCHGIRKLQRYPGGCRLSSSRGSGAGSGLHPGLLCCDRPRVSGQRGSSAGRQ